VVNYPVLAEGSARWLLVLHTALGVAAVAASTHLVIWLRRYLRGRRELRRAVLKFAAISLALHVATFVAGTLMYPTYKVEVRTAYLENATAVASEATARAAAIEHVTGRHELPATAAIVKRAAQAARWFDVKEHWVALGLIVSAALVLLLRLWDPERDGGPLAPIALGLATVVAGTLWLAAIIGVLTASWKAV
jgi:hypothetical protein